MRPTKESTVAAVVRGTRALLIAQLLAALLATLATGFVVLQLGPLIAERDEIRGEIATARDENVQLQRKTARLLDDLAAAKDTAAHMDSEIQELRVTLQNARRTTQFVSQAIKYYHSRKYDQAVVWYDKALTLDAKNPWILDLKSYSQFRAEDIDGAIASIKSALELEPTYLYGFSELSRYQCAAKDFDGAVQTFGQALETHGPEASTLYTNLLKTDGQFERLCSSARNRFLEAISKSEANE